MNYIIVHELQINSMEKKLPTGYEKRPAGVFSIIHSAALLNEATETK